MRAGGELADDPYVLYGKPMREPSVGERDVSATPVFIPGVMCDASFWAPLLAEPGPWTRVSVVIDHERARLRGREATWGTA